MAKYTPLTTNAKDNKNRYLVIAGKASAAVLASLAFTACGGSSSHDKVTTTTAPIETTTTTEPATPPTITVAQNLCARISNTLVERALTTSGIVQGSACLSTNPNSVPVYGQQEFAEWGGPINIRNGIYINVMENPQTNYGDGYSAAKSSLTPNSSISVNGNEGFFTTFDPQNPTEKFKVGDYLLSVSINEVSQSMSSTSAEAILSSVASVAMTHGFSH